MPCNKCCLFYITVLVCMLNNAKVNGDCVLETYFLQNDWHLALLYDNQNVQLLREPRVKNGSVLFMVCGGNDITEITCENGEFKPPLPSSGCRNRLLPQLKLENDRELCLFNLYRLGFQIRCKDNDYFFETYKACFDFKQKRAVFTINEAYPFVISRPYGMQFDPDEIFTMYIFAAYNKRDIYARFQSLLGSTQTFMPNNAGNERIDRGHLTPVADYLTNPLISTTFKMINVIPQFHTINDGNWKTLEEWARNPINTPSKVCSGAFRNILELPDTEGNMKCMFLRDDSLVPIPLWTYKIVFNRLGERTVFVQYNNIHDKQEPPNLPYDMCQRISCPSSVNLRNSNYYGYTFCCQPEHFMQSVVPNLKGYC